MEEEFWKTIPISIRYEASTHGRIRRKKTGRILKQDNTLRGYRRVDIKGTDKENITRFVHRLVAITFIPNPENKATVNHKKHDPTNNNVSNLEWSSHTEQANHSRKRKLTPEEDASNDTWGKRKIWKCDMVSGDKLEMFKTVRGAACGIKSSLFGMSQIFDVAENHEISISIPGCRQSRLTACGYKWKFDELRVFTSEEWRDINPLDAKGADGYKISSLGRLCNPRGMVTSTRADGYATHLIEGKKIKSHNLVASTFLERVQGKDYVNHIDADKNHPAVENLEFVTLSENMQHAHDNGLINRETHRVLQFDLEGNFLKEWASAKDVESEVSYGRIRGAIGTGSPAGGYLWERTSEDKDRVVKLRESDRQFKKIKQFDMNGVFLRDFDSIAEAQKEVPGLQRNAPSRRRASAGFRWKLATDNTPFEKKATTHFTPINQYDLDMNLIKRYPSVSAARAEFPNVYRAAKDAKVYKGFIWKYSTDKTPLKTSSRSDDKRKKRVNQYDLDMTFLETHESVAAAQIHLPGINVRKAIKNSEPSKGFHWAYA